MPSQAANATALRADGHRMQVYLSAMVDTANPVLVGALSATPDAASALNLAYTTSSGNSANVKRGMRVVIETAGGVYKGTLSVRFAGTISSTNLPVREFSEGHVQAVSGDVLKVYNDFLLTDRLVAATETFDPDYETYVAQNGTVKPIPTSGGHWAGFTDSGQTYATITLYGAESYTIDEDSAGSVTHLWTLPTGVAFAPGSANTDASPTIRADVGYYVIQHDVTDSTNSASDVQYVAVRVHDTTHLPYDITLDAPIAGEPARGFGFAVSLYENAELSTLPDLCPVILWTRETINGTVQSFGAKVSGRSHILCVGYLRRDQFSLDSTGVTPVRFEVVSPLARLFELPGFSKVMDRVASPAGWSEVEALTVKRGIVLLLRYYTNAPQLFDLVFDGFDDANYPALYLQKKTPGDQVSELVDSRGARLAADHSGRMEVQQRLDLTPIADRAAVTTTFTLTAEDCLQVDVEREHVRPVETHHTRGYTAGTTTAESLTVFAKWAASPGGGASSPVTERLIVDSVADLYEQAAMRGAAEDRVYFDANGLQYHAPRVTVTLPGSYWGLFRFYREYVVLDLDETTNGRGIDLSIFKFIPVSAELDLSGGTGRVKVVLQAATYAIGAVDDTPTSEAITIAQPSFNYASPVNFGDSSDFILGRGTYNLGFISDDGYLYLGDTRPTSPVWSRYSLASLGMLGTPVMYIVDAFDFSGGVLITSTKAYKATDIGTGSRALANEYAFRYPSALRSLQSERGTEGYFVCASHEPSGRVDVDYTDDGGVTWNRTQDIGGIWSGSGGSDNTNPGIYVFAGTAGKVLISALTTGSVTSGRLKVSTDYGATFSDFDGNTLPYLLADEIHAPFQDESIIYHGYHVTVSLATNYRLYKTIGGVATNISPSDGTASYGVENQFGVKTCDIDKNSVLVAARRHAPTVNWGVWLSRNAGADWTALVSPSTSVKYRAVSFAGDDPNVAWFWGTAGAIAVSRNLNATTPAIKDLSGNLSSFTSPAVGRILNIFGV